MGDAKKADDEKRKEYEKGTPQSGPTATLPLHASGLASPFTGLENALADMAGLLASGVRFPDLNLSPSYFDPLIFQPEDLSRRHELQDEISSLRRKVDDQALSLARAHLGVSEKEQQIAQLNRDFAELQEKQQLGFLLRNVNAEAEVQLLRSEQFRKQFLETKTCSAFVISVDIRRSTELMLKAKDPELFATFITTLYHQLAQIVTNAFGVFDKFTGDGILAFFPDFFSGQDAGYRAVEVADRCHAAFDQHYRQSRASFNSVLMDVGLGIGIDFGSVHLVQTIGSLTVVGSPVVYACRLSGARSGTTLLNHPAYEQIIKRFSSLCVLNEDSLEVKHEGPTLAYRVRLNGSAYTPQLPDWRTVGGEPVRP